MRTSAPITPSPALRPVEMCEVFEVVAPTMAVLLDAELGDVAGTVAIEGEAAVADPMVGEAGTGGGEELGLDDVDPEFPE